MFTGFLRNEWGNLMRHGVWKVLLKLKLVSLLVLGLASCGGGQPANGQPGGGGGNGGANSPRAGDYLWELSLIDSNLYIATLDSNSGQLGAPTLSGGEACNSQGTIPSIAVTPSGLFTFVIDKCIASIHVYSMNGPGVVLRESPGSPYYFLNDLASIAISPSGKFLFALGANPDAIYTLPFNGTNGQLIQGTTTALSGNLRELILDPQGKFAFVNDLTDGKVLAYSVGSDGSLTPVPGSPFAVPAGGLPVNLAITSDGNFLYSPLIPSGIAAFAVNRSTGALSNIAGSPFATTNQPFSLAIGGGGRFIYSIGGRSNNEIEAFTMDSSGALTALAGSPFAMSSQLGSLTVDGSGKFLYATVWASTLSESAVLGFAIDSSTGNLTSLTGSPYNSAPFPVDSVILNIP